MRDVSFGQYYPAKSFVHNMDSRSKLIIILSYIVLLFFIPTLSSFAKSGGSINEYLLLAGICYIAVSLFLTVAIILSRVPLFKVLRSIRGVIFLIIFMMIISALFYGGNSFEGSWKAQWWIFKVSQEGLINAASMSLRLMFLVVGPALLTLTTTPVALTDGIESLLKPLKVIKFPVHEFAIIMSIALRLIPSLSEKTTTIINAQKARCADFDSKNLFKKAKALLPVLIPLFVSAFRIADDLSDAMDSRCYNGAKGRTRMKKLRFRTRDFFAILFMAALFFFILCIKYQWFSIPAFFIAWL
jgi:energy-coupling factor transport system permease protein